MASYFNRQFVGKPGFVMNDHLSSPVIAYRIKRVSIYGRTARYVNLLAADRVYLHAMSPWNAVSSYLTRFTFSLAGSFVSVALSLRSPSVAVSDCRVLCCPDFPLAQ